MIIEKTGDFHTDLSMLHLLLEVGCIEHDEYLDRCAAIQQAAFDKMPAQRRCAWHPKFTGEALILSEGKLPASDGCCDSCTARVMAEIEARRQAV